MSRLVLTTLPKLLNIPLMYTIYTYSYELLKGVGREGTFVGECTYFRRVGEELASEMRSGVGHGQWLMRSPIRPEESPLHT